MFLLPLSLFISYRVAVTKEGTQFNACLALAALQLIGFVALFTVALVDGGTVDPKELP